MTIFKDIIHVFCELNNVQKFQRGHPNEGHRPLPNCPNFCFLCPLSRITHKAEMEMLLLAAI